MTVLLVLGTFLVFIALDYLLNRRKAIATVLVEAPTPAAAEAKRPGPRGDRAEGPEVGARDPVHSVGPGLAPVAQLDRAVDF